MPVPLTADPTHWRHAEECPWLWTAVCSCGLSAVRDAIAAGHRVVIGPDGVEGRLIGTWLAGDYEIVPLKEP